MTDDLNGIKVALIHDFLVCSGGAERVLAVLADMYPEAPIYTLLYDTEAMRGQFNHRDIRTSFLQKFPHFLRKRYRWLLPFFSVAVEAIDLRDFDIVISSSGAWSKGIVTRLNTKHIAYIHSPMRYVWDYNERYLQDQEHSNGGFHIFKRLILSYLRLWDREAADRPDVLLANSQYTQSRIQKYYRRDSTVAYPPVINESYAKNNATDHLEHSVLSASMEKYDSFFGYVSKEYFLVVSRLTENKKVQLAIEAFNKLGLPLIVVGEGNQMQALEKIAQPHCKLVGWQSDERKQILYKNARAVIFPAEDDFGIVMVEAMSHGTPVIAYAEGGAREIVTEGVTGEFFTSQQPEIIADGVRRFLEHSGEYDTLAMQKTAEQFSRETFEKNIHAQIALLYSSVKTQGV